MSSPHERLRALREEETRIKIEMIKTQQEIDARTPVFELHGWTKESTGKHSPHRIGVFSTFEKALDMQHTLEMDGGNGFVIFAVRKDKVQLKNAYGHNPSFATLDGPIDKNGYVSD